MSYLTCYTEDSKQCVQLYEPSTSHILTTESFVTTIKSLSGDLIQLLLTKKCNASCIKRFLTTNMNYNYQFIEMKLICSEENPDEPHIGLLTTIYSLPSHTLYLLIEENPIYEITRKYTYSTSSELTFYSDLFKLEKYSPPYDLSFHFIADFRKLESSDLVNGNFINWIKNAQFCHKVTDIVIDISHSDFYSIYSTLPTLLSHRTYRHRVIHLFRSSTDEIPPQQKDMAYFTHLLSPLQKEWKLCMYFYPNTLGIHPFLAYRLY